VQKIDMDDVRHELVENVDLRPEILLHVRGETLDEIRIADRELQGPVPRFVSLDLTAARTAFVRHASILPVARSGDAGSASALATSATRTALAVPARPVRPPPRTPPRPA
jgi:hypothetical protein